MNPLSAYLSGDDEDGDSDESAEIQSLIDSYRYNQEGREKADQSTKKRKHKKRKNKKKPNHSLDPLKARITELMTIFEDNGLFIPSPESLSERGKVWSSRIYGADKKKQRKNAERQLLEDRIGQLEHCLKHEHGMDI